MVLVAGKIPEALSMRNRETTRVKPAKDEACSPSLNQRVSPTNAGYLADRRSLFILEVLRIFLSDLDPTFALAGLTTSERWPQKIKVLLGSAEKGEV